MFFLDSRRLVIGLLLFGSSLWSHGVSAADRVLEVRADAVAPIALTPYFSVLEDPTLELTLEDVRSAEVGGRFKPAAELDSDLSFGYTRSAYWLRLTLSNPGDEAREHMLEIRYSGLSSIQFYPSMADAQPNPVLTGSILPFQSRGYANRFFVFPPRTAPHASQTIYLRVQSFGPVAVPAWLWTPTAFHTYERHDYTAQAWYFGIATAMILFNALLFIALRDRAYLLYVAFASCLTLTIASQNGLGKEFLWQEGPTWSNIATSVGYCYSLLTLLLFMRHMLQTPVMIKHSDRLLMPLMGLFLISPVGFAIALPTLIKPAVFVYAGTAALVLIIGGWCVYQRQRSAYFFLAAFTVLCLAALVSVARALGWLPTNLITVNALQFGSGLEMMLLAFALADRFNQIRKEKAVAQKAALVVQQSMVEALQASERVLEERVLLRTSEVTAKNAELTQAMSLLATVERIARHDLKTPLGSLAAAPDLLRAGRTMDPQEEKVLRLMEQAANHALQMVNLSLDFYRMESGSYRPTFVCVDLSAVVGTVIQDLAAQAASKEIEVQVADELAPVYAQAEEALCYSIIANLTKNAIEAAPTQSVVRLALTDGPVVRLCIHNLGAVPYALRDCFFDKHATEGKAGGTGLGTYSAALLTKAHQGSLTMETSDTDGTRLTLQLNRWEGAPFAPADAPTIPPSSAVSMVAHCQRVLVADDDEFNRMIVLDRLSKALTECRCAMNGREVLEIVHRWRPDLILMDIEMPLMGGFEALVEIRAFQRHAGQAPSLIVAYSGNDDPQSRATYLMHGFDDCMSKPGSQDAVLALLRTSGARARTLT